MACKYVYDSKLSSPNSELSEETLNYILGKGELTNNHVVYVADSVLELYGILAQTNPALLKGESGAIRFYSSDLKSLQLEILEKVKEDYKKASSKGNLGQGVTSIIEQVIVPYKKGFEKTIEGDFASKFFMEFGTAIHACIGAYNTVNQEKVISDTLDKLNAFRTELNAKIADGTFKVTADLQSRLAILFKPEPLNRDEILELCQSIHELEFTDKEVKFEVPIHYESPTGEHINGTIDAIIIDNDGNVTIYDFKTSAFPKMSTTTQQRHYAQLVMHRNMLASYGIPANKIKINNCHINYSDGHFGTPEFKIFDLNNYRNPVKDLSNIQSKLRLYFPLYKSTMPEAELTKLLGDIKKVKHTIFTERALNKDLLENFSDYLSHIDKDKPFYSELLEDTIRVKVEGTRISITTSDGKTQNLSFDTFCKEELEKRLSNKFETVQLFKDALISKDPLQISSLLSARFGRNINLMNQLKHYASLNYEVVEDSPIFDEFGIIVLYDSVNKTYDFVNIAPYVNLDYTYHMSLDESKSMNLLGNILNNRALDTYKDANMHASIDNILTLLTLMIASLAQDTLRTEGSFKIGNISVISSITGNGTFHTDYSKFVKQFAVILAYMSQHPGALQNEELLKQTYLGLKNTQFTSFTDNISRKLSDILQLAVFEENSNMTDVWISDFNEASTKATLSERISSLEELQENFRIEYANELNITNKYDRQYVSDIQKIDQLLSVLINSYRGLVSDLAFVTSSMSIDFDNSLRVARLLVKNGNLGKVTPSGVLVTGLLQGLSTATPYANPDDTVRMLSTLHNYGTTKIQLEAEKFIESQNNATIEWLLAKKSVWSIILVSNHRGLYENLFVHDEKGNVDKSFKFKNPFTDNSLDDADKKFLKNSIWNLLRIKSTVFDENMRRKSFNELTENEIKKLKSYITSDPHSLDVPLRSAKGDRLLAESFKYLIKGDKTSLKDIWHKKLEKTRNWWDPSGLSDKLLDEKQKKMDALEAYSMYNESASDRNKRLESPIESFEWNVNFLVNDFIYSEVTCNVNRQILDTTDRMVATLQYISAMTGRDLSGQIEEIKNRTTISIYNSNTVDLDYKDLSTVTNYLRKIYNIGVISFRPVLMAKEMTLGRIKNYMYAGFGYFGNDNISLKTMLAADAVVFGEGIVTDKWNKATGQMKPSDRSKVEALNWLFRIANMDANVVSQKTVADRLGILNTKGDIAYWTNTRPDWYNRMSIFVAKMMEDGTWDAYSLDKDNHLVYDISKDKRYSVYWRYRKNPPKPNESNYAEFLKQKARYLWALNSCIKAELTNPDGSALKEGDALPIAYTVEETNSIKEIVGMLYGYYNHEEKTSFQTGTYSQLMMAFKTYLAGELKHYFAIPNGKTSIGRVEHVLQLGEDGKLHKMYIHHDASLDIDTYVTEEERSEEDIPYYDWTAHPIEGLITSTLACIGDVFTEEGRLDLRTNVLRRRNCELFLIRMLWANLLGALGLLFFASDGDKDELTKSALIAFKTLQKVGNDLSFYHSVIEPIDDLHLVGVDYLELSTKSTIKALTNGDDILLATLYKNWSAVKDIAKPVV